MVLSARGGRERLLPRSHGARARQGASSDVRSRLRHRQKQSTADLFVVSGNTTRHCGMLCQDMRSRRPCNCDDDEMNELDTAPYEGRM